MDYTRIVRHALTFAGAAGLALAAAAPASASQAAATPGWRVVKTIGLDGGGTITEFTAVFPDDAWLTWEGVDRNNVPVDEVLHWTGSAWRPVPVPANLNSYVQQTVGIGATSAKNVWLITDEYSRAEKVLHWNGSKWSLLTVPSWVVHGNLSGGVRIASAFFGISSYWVFSLGIDAFTKPDHYVARYDGHSWTKMTLPLIPDEVSAVSPTDIWILGNSLANPDKDALAHWNGKKWSPLGLPRVTVPKGSTQYPANLTALGPSNVWMTWVDITGQAGAATEYLLHWNGRSWSKVDLKYPTSWVADVAADGHGGLWLSASGPGPKYLSHFYHLNGGHWTEYSYPTAVGYNPAALALVPGTRSMWAWHTYAPTGTTNSTVILKYGP